MKKFILLILVIIVFFYLAINYIYSDKQETFVSGTTGITQLCSPTDPSYNIPSVCFDISYIQNGNTVQAKAIIDNAYFIDASGYLAPIPYGNIASENKKSFLPKSQIAKYEYAVVNNTNALLDASINQLQQLLNAVPPPSASQSAIYKQQLYNLQQQKMNNADSNKTSNSQYNSDNLDITYHADPTKETQPDGSTAGVGQMWVDISGKLVAVPYSDVSNTTLYYSSGDYIFNAASYVPNYEESVFLSKLTNEHTTSKVYNQHGNQTGFCDATKSSTIEREAKCNTLNANICASTSCCVLLGGEKCVAGDQFGPTIKSNYSDTLVVNRDYYYYQGKCYGHCK